MRLSALSGSVRRKVVRGPTRLVSAIAIAIALATTGYATAPQPGSPTPAPGGPSSAVRNYKLDDVVSARAGANSQDTSKVIVVLAPGAKLPLQFGKYARGGKLDLINGQALDVPNSVLNQLAAHPDVFRVHDDRPTFAHNYRTSVTVGAREVQNALGYTGAGVGVAVIDSGITTWHDDLTGSAGSYPYGNQRVTKFVDFVSGNSQPYDDNGHGSHVAGTILGNGFDS